MNPRGQFEWGLWSVGAALLVVMALATAPTSIETGQGRDVMSNQHHGGAESATH